MKARGTRVGESHRRWSLVVVLALTLLPAVVRAEEFTLTSTTFHDGDTLRADQASSGNDASGKACGGKNISPQLTWRGAPAETQSFALTLIDIDGRRGAGVTHWLLYNIPASVTSLALGDGTAGKYTAGKNIYDQTTYLGPCTSLGEAPHHYVVTIFALDVLPSLPPGLDRDNFIRAVQPHVIREMSIIGRFQRSP